MSSGPDASPGDSTPWHASFWEFCTRYCTSRFGEDWHLAPELSLLIHAEATTIPRQVVVSTPRGTNNTIELLFGTSLYDLKTRAMPPAEELMSESDLSFPTTLTQGFSPA